RRRSDSNRCIKVLQTSPLPLGYGAIRTCRRHYNQTSTLSVREMPVEARVFAGPHLVNVEDLPEVIAEMLDDMVDRLKAGGGVRLNRITIQQAVAMERFENGIDLADRCTNA